MSTSLESSYRRWLRAYPRSYRAEREDEIVSVLLEAAGPDQSRASAAEAIDLVRAGLARRFLRSPEPPPVTPWSDALAALAAFVIAMLVAAVLSSRVLFPLVHPGALPVEVFTRSAANVVGVVASASIVVAAGLVLRGRSRLAGWFVAVSAGLGLLSPFVGVTGGDTSALWSSVTVHVGTTLLAIAAAVILVTGRDGQRGVELWGTRNLSIAIVGWAITDTALAWLAFQQPPDALIVSLLPIAPVLVAGVAMWPHVRHRTDARRLRQVLLAAFAIFVVGQRLEVVVGLSWRLWPNALDVVAFVVVIAGLRSMLRVRRPEVEVEAESRT